MNTYNYSTFFLLTLKSIQKIIIIMRKNLLRLTFLTLPLFGFSQTYFSDNFDDENITDWTLYDEDGDGHNWETVALTGLTPAIASYSFDNETESALTPNNYIVSPAINLSTATSALLKFKVKAQDAGWAAETYSVYVATSNTVAAFLATTPVLTENVATNGLGGVFYSKIIDLTAFAGQPQVYIAFRHHNSTDMFSLHIDDVTVTAAPTIAPSCTTIVSPANNATGVPVNATLSWTANADADSYDVYLDSNPNPTTLVGNVSGTSFTVTNNLELSTVYYWKVVPRNTAGEATGCTAYSFTTSSIPLYCGPLSFSFEFFGFEFDGTEPITRVNFAGIDNQSPAIATDTPHEMFIDKVANVNTGSTYNITLEGNTNGDYTSKFAVFIDWNQNGILNDAGEVYEITETLTNSTGIDGKKVTHSIAVPADALSGNTRMRVKKVYDDEDIDVLNLPNPCIGGSYGQAEDYSVNVTTLAVSEVRKANIKAYPNPVRDIFNIEAQAKIKSVKVYDVAGKQILTKDLNDVKSQIDFSRFGAGVYVVTTLLEDGTSTSTKVIKK